MKKQTSLNIGKVKNKTSKTSSILTFSTILFLSQRFFLYRDIYNVPFWKSIFLLTTLSIVFYSLLNIKKIVSFPAVIAFKGVTQYIALFISIGSTLFGISNQIYASNQESVSVKCKILHVSEGGGKLSSDIQINLDGQRIDLINTFDTGVIRKLKSDKRILLNSYVDITYKNGLFDMIKLEDAHIDINR